PDLQEGRVPTPQRVVPEFVARNLPTRGPLLKSAGPLARRLPPIARLVSRLRAPRSEPGHREEKEEDEQGEQHSSGPTPVPASTHGQFLASRFGDLSRILSALAGR